ncbi:MAG: hypothetical protein N2255_07465 [Kiritimatiellae bacterium]|nr:hypothetical protein [Kiritimatiellia bacterium]
MAGQEIRYGKLFGSGGRAVVVACDHGMFDGPHKGMENIPGLLERIGDEPDGVLLSPGMLARSAGFFARRSAPAPIVRLNFNSVFCFRWGYSNSVVAHLYEPEEAIRLGAEWVLICLTLKTGSEATDAKNAEIFGELCAKAHRLGLPVMGEYFPSRHLEKAPDEFHEEVLIGCRMLAELGADCIKTFYTNKFREIATTCPIPVLGLGAEKAASDLEALRLAERQIGDGARGVVFGRNAVQASNPRRFVAALQEIVRRGTPAQEAAQKYGLTT